MKAADTERLIAAYDRLSRTTGCMLHAAQRKDWERLVELEKDCADLVAELNALERDGTLPREMRARKQTVIRKVLADDAAIRDITEPWLQHLASMLGSNRSEQRLLKTYGPPPAG